MDCGLTVDDLAKLRNLFVKYAQKEYGFLT